MGRRYKLCIGQRKNLWHWRNLTHQHPSDEESTLSNEDDQSKIFPSDLPCSNIDQEENINSLLEKQLDIFPHESSSDQLCFFPSEEQDIVCTSAKLVNRKCVVISLKLVRRMNTSILETATASN